MSFRARLEVICCELRVSRRVVRDVIRSDDIAFVDERRVQRQPQLEAWPGELRMASAARPVRQRPTLMRQLAALRGRRRWPGRGRGRGRGHEDADDADRHYAAASRRQQNAS